MKQLSGFRLDLYRRRPLQNQLKKISPAFWIRFSDDAAIAHPPAESIFFVAIWILAAPFNTNTKLVGAAAKGYSHFLLIKNDIRLVAFSLNGSKLSEGGKRNIFSVSVQLCIKHGPYGVSDFLGNSAANQGLIALPIFLHLLFEISLRKSIPANYLVAKHT